VAETICAKKDRTHTNERLERMGGRCFKGRYTGTDSESSKDGLWEAKSPKVGVYLKSAEISRRELQSGMEQLTAKPPSETRGAPTNECVADCKCTES
jgi:hypothetical protein